MLYFWKNENNLRSRSLLFLSFGMLLVFLFNGCEKDDICAEATPTTPQLIIRFYDVASPEDLKSVTGLFAYALEDDGSIVPIDGLAQNNTDSIAIPLRTDRTSTRFVLHKDFAIDNNGMLLGNPETITVNYTTDDVYVSRACGYKTVFLDMLFGVSLDTDNWIINSDVVNNNVENQNAAHVQVFH
ncbi:MAG: hypothetical protein HKN00_05605 [Flavobacteriaceae bacterium]|nr:hypothetical protein [Bacteroidia bacterium]MBT8287752.1 hypothetical protein [Bacteroidia bacterium]NNF74638.1 hypothetical protein [Flavobacteriaceae bacterium]NNK74047.1 hypothetical protein [Flavobacteriaceae bacterium]